MVKDRRQDVSPTETSMAVTRQKKESVLQDLIKDWEKAKSTIFATYQGIPVKEFSSLRRELHQKGAKLKIAKKTLIRLAAKKLNYPEISEATLPGAVSITFGFQDEVAAARTLSAFAKTHPQVEILAGFMEGRLLSQKEAKFLSTIPERKELLAKLVGSLNAPISGFHGVLYGLLRNFVYALSEIQKKRALTAGAETTTAATEATATSSHNPS